MNVDDQIKTMQRQIDLLQKKIEWLQKRRTALASLEVKISAYVDRVDFDNLSHKDIVSVIRGLGGKWKKSPNGAVANRIDYESEIDGIPVRCWAGEPPPSCRIVEVEQEVPEKVIPAHTVKVKKMICSPASEPLAFAIAQKQTTP